MSTQNENSLSDRMSVLLKHARERFTEEFTAPALVPFGLDGRSLAVMTVLAGRGRQSQQEAADELGVDRTTMVALIDGLESKGFVARAPHPADRRKNVVTLTESGRDVFEQASAASKEAERRFLEPLGDADVAHLKASLRLLIERTPSQ